MYPDTLKAYLDEKLMALGIAEEAREELHKAISQQLATTITRTKQDISQRLSDELVRSLSRLFAVLIHDWLDSVTPPSSAISWPRPPTLTGASMPSNKEKKP